MSSKSIGSNILKFVSKQKALVAVIAVLVLMIFSKTNFFSAYNLLEIVNSASIYLIVAAGTTLVIIAAGCDLSVGGMIGLSGVVSIMLMRTLPMPVAILCSLAIGAVVGFINGFLVVHQKTEPFVITFGMGMVLKGISLQLTNAKPISCSNPNFVNLGNAKIFGTVTYLALLTIVVLAVVFIILRYTQLGRNIYAVGGDYDVALYAGINARRTKWTAFIISGFTAALAGVMLSSRLNAGSALYGDPFPLLIHVGAVIGGTSLTGGKGGIPQTLLGIISLTVLLNAMTMMQISGYVQKLIQGIVIVLILWFDNFQIKRQREAV